MKQKLSVTYMMTDLFVKKINTDFQGLIGNFLYLCQKDFIKYFLNANAKTMSRISVTVEQTNQAFMLAEWLKNIRFVQEVSIDVDKTAKGNAEAVQKVLDSIKSKHLFSDVTDPVAYQKQIRNEWR